MSKITTAEQNKALVLDAFNTLFNKRDYEAAERFWSPDYIQHSAHIAPGRDGLFELVRQRRRRLKYEHQPNPSERRLRHRARSLLRPRPAPTLDRRRYPPHREWHSGRALGRLQDEVSKANSVSGLPMFGDRFPD